MRKRAQPPVFSVGTIISCPGCGEGLYKVTQRATAQELVLDNGQLLTPLNRTIPSRQEWQRFACPFCCVSLFRQGQVHTFQHGWA
jgi:hypothetical protein